MLGHGDDDDLASPTFLQQWLQLQGRVLAMSPETRLRDVLRAIAGACNDILRGSFCIVQPYDASLDRFLPEQFTAIGLPEVEAFPWADPRPDGATRAALRESLLVIEDYDAGAVRYPFLVGTGAFRAAAEIKAAIGVRLQAGAESVGVLFVNYLQTHRFLAEEVQLARLASDLAAIAIRNARLIETNREREALAVALRDSAAALNSTLDLPQVLERILANVGRVVPHTEATVLLYEAGLARSAAHSSRRERAVGPPDGPLSVAETPELRRMAETGAPCLIVDTRESPYWSVRSDMCWVRSYLGAPIRAHGRLIGFLNLYSENAGFFEPGHAGRLEAFADQAALAIENARVYGVAERELNAIIRVAQKLIQEALQPNIDLDQFLTQVMDQTLGLVAFDFGWLLLREGDRVRIRAADAAHRADLGTTFAIEDCISGLAMLRREAIHIPNLLHLPEELRRIYKAPRNAEGAMRSELTVPLVVGNDAIGALSVESRHPDAFEARHVEMLRLLSDHAALAIELARSRQEAAALSDIGTELARETEMPAVVRSVLERALLLIKARFGQLLLAEGADLVVHYTTNVPPRDLGLRVALQESVCGLAVQERKPVIVPDVTRAEYRVVELTSIAAGAPVETVLRSTGHPRYHRVLEREKARIRAELVIPLWSRGQAVGVLNLETPNETGFDEQQRANLAAYAQSEGVSFATALMQRDEPEMRRLLAGALAHAGTSFGQLLALEGNELVIVQTTGGEPRGTRVPVETSVTGQAVAGQAEVYVPDVDDDPRYRRYLGEEMKSELAVPIISSDQIIGVLNVESTVPNFFSSEHARILQALASQAAVAIERARRTEVERLAAIGGLAGDIIHRLNNPIGALSGWVSLLKGKPFYDKLTAEYPYLAQFVAHAEHDLGRAKSIIQELRTELRRRVPVPVILQPMIQEALERSGLAAQGGDIRVDLALPELPIRVLAGPSLVSVLWNLFDNARKAMVDGGTLSISARPAEEQGWTLIEVSDTGVGIEPWRLPFIFQPGESSMADRYAPAHGLGLWWTRSQVEGFGGMIQVSSQFGHGTLVALLLRESP